MLLDKECCATETDEMHKESMSCQTENLGIEKGVLVKPHCNNRETAMVPRRFKAASSQVEVKMVTVPVQIEKRYLMSDASTQWDIKIMGGPSAFPPVERALRIRPLIYADGLYYHRATQTDWRGQSLFHKATQFPEREYRDADKEMGSSNIHILSSEPSSTNMFLPGLTSFQSMMNYSLLGMPQTQMMMMPPNLVAPVPLMPADSSEGIGDSNSSVGEPCSIHELDTRSLSSAGSPGISASIGGSSALSPQIRSSVPLQSFSPQTSQRMKETSPRPDTSRISPQFRQGEGNVPGLDHPLIPTANMMRFPPPTLHKKPPPTRDQSPQKEGQPRSIPVQTSSRGHSQLNQPSSAQHQQPRVTGQQPGVVQQNVRLQAQQHLSQFQQPYMYQPGWYNYMPTWR